MTKVTFSLQGDKILSVDILGHAGYAEEGEDIVCAAISSAVMLTHALLYDVQHIPVDTLIEDEGAHIRFTLPKDTVERGQDALQALKLHFSELEQNYSDFLNVMEVHTDAEDYSFSRIKRAQVLPRTAVIPSPSDWALSAQTVRPYRQATSSFASAARRSIRA